MIRMKIHSLENMQKDNKMLKSKVKLLHDEIQEIHRHGEYEVEKSQLANELRECKFWEVRVYRQAAEEGSVLW